MLNGRKPVTARVAAVLDEALEAGGEIVAAAEAEMASHPPKDMELTRRHLEDTISADAMSARARRLSARSGRSREGEYPHPSTFNI